MILGLSMTAVLTVVMAGSDGDNCYQYGGEADTICLCCKSGYTGINCTAICPNCESRLLQGSRCVQQCKSGYYGDMCNKTCPAACVHGDLGNPCKERNGTAVCTECNPGFYGTQCQYQCSKWCQGNVCYKVDGTCRECKDKYRHGEFCNIQCSIDCSTGTCERNGSCIGSCIYGHYGTNCSLLCGDNCRNGKCRHHSISTFQCTDGCVHEYWGMNCTQRCSVNCARCNQSSGTCSKCMPNTIKRCEMNHCIPGNILCEAGIGNESTKTNKEIKWTERVPYDIITISIIAILVLVAVSCWCCRKRKQKGRAIMKKRKTSSHYHQYMKIQTMNKEKKMTVDEVIAILKSKYHRRHYHIEKMFLHHVVNGNEEHTTKDKFKKVLDSCEIFMVDDHFHQLILKLDCHEHGLKDLEDFERRLEKL